MKKLRIGQISPLNLPVPPPKYGGSEKVIDFLCRKLTERGHEVFLFGSGDSKVKCNLIPIIEKALWISRPKDSGSYYAYQMAVIGRKTKTLKLDILHDHLGPLSLSLYGQMKIPIVHTLHVPFANGDRIWVYKKLNAKLVSISFHQRKPAPDLNYVANIYNGIDVENYPFNPRPKDYFVWVGELSPRKGIYEVIKIAKAAKLKLVLAGRIPPPQQRSDFAFFKRYIEKSLNKRNIKYVGELTNNELKEVYKNAVAFLNPLQWEEPFGLTMVEAQATGTPVIAFRRGSVPEVINHRQTGFIIKPRKGGEVNYEGFMEKIKIVGKISRKECRAWVEKRFTTKKMVDEYEKLYYKLRDKNKNSRK